eukprot:4754_1
MASNEVVVENQTANEAPTGFKRRQSTIWTSILEFSLGILLLVLGIMEIMESGWWGWMRILASFILFAYAGATAWCDVEDLGSDLKVRFGPLTNLLCCMGEIRIPYNQMRSYHDPVDCNEGSCGYGIGMNKCYSLRQHSNCSNNCKQRQIVIEYKTPRTLCGYPYTKVVIAVDGGDYQAFRRMLDGKFDVIAPTATL